MQTRPQLAVQTSESSVGRQQTKRCPSKTEEPARKKPRDVWPSTTHMTQAAFNSFFKSPQKASGEVEQIAEGSVADATDVVAEGSVAAASDVVVVGSVADSMLEEGLSEVKSEFDR